jgi:hypothetical protein
LPVHVQDDNNIAQRNIEIFNPGDSDSDAFIGMVAGTGDKSGLATLLLDASKLQDATAIKLHLADAEAMKLILSGAKLAEREQHSPVPPSMSLVKYGGVDAIEIKGLDDKMEIPLRLDGGSYTLLLVAVEGKPTGDLHITQRLGDGQLSGGYGIRWAGDKKV